MKIIVVCLIVLAFSGVCMADEKSEMEWKYRALVAEFNQAQQKLPQFRAFQTFLEELNKKGLMIDQKTGKVIERPKVPASKPEDKPESKVEPQKETPKK